MTPDPYAGVPAGGRLLVAGPDAADRAAFARVATPYLAKRESLHDLHLAVLAQVADGRYPQAHLVGVEDAAGDLVALLLRTPPHPLLVPHGGDPVARAALLAWFADHDPDLPALVGPAGDVAEAARAWAEATGRRTVLAMRQGVFRLRAVTPAARAAGRMRDATPADRPLLLRWFEAFERDAFGAVRTPPEATVATFDAAPGRRLALWIDDAGEPVSMAARTGVTPSGVRIGAVYTPPERRRRGYAEAVVAALSAAELGAGARQCFLMTDLANPTSNAIYERVGYQRIGESAEWRVRPSDAPA